MHPYSNLPDRQYWRRSSSRWLSGDLDGIYTPRFHVDPTTRVATGGSCFAQHVARHLKERNYNFLDFEPSPTLLPSSERSKYGYDMYSARYGNIYTSRQLLQLIQAAKGDISVDEVWESDGRYYDPLRPGIEPGGFSSPDEVEALRKGHHAAVRRMLLGIDVFVFTLGLTEVWVSRNTGLAYQTCPGTIAGKFNPDEHAFVNLSYPEVMKDMDLIIRYLRKINRSIKFILTVSPVPLAATAVDQHVVVSSTLSKSILRSVAGALADKYDFVDYFPSYEIVTTHLGRGGAYEDNMREVRPAAVEEVMKWFFGTQEGNRPEVAASALGTADDEITAEEARIRTEMDIVCEEAALDQSATR